MSNDKNPQRKVGYKNPPAEHRFKKGQSGNPSGLSSEARAAAGPTGSSIDEKTKRSIVALSRRKVTITENGRRKRLTYQDAILHLLFRNALQNDKRSIHAVIKLLTGIETEARDNHHQHFRSLMEFKIGAEKTGYGASGPNPRYPDPRDIEFDLPTGKIWIAGPMNAEEAELFDLVAAERDDWIEEYEGAIQQRDATPSEQAEQDVASALESIRRWNAMLPKRMRREPQLVASDEEDAGDRLARRLQRLQEEKDIARPKRRKRT